MLAGALLAHAGGAWAQAPMTQGDALRLGTTAGGESSEIQAAWLRAVAAHQAAAHLDTVRETVAVAIEMARGLRATGAWSALDVLRQETAAAEFTVDALRVRTDAKLEVERLAHMLRVSAITLALPTQLAEVPREPVTMPPLAADASAERAWALRTAYLRYGAAHQRAVLYQTAILPLRRAIAEETTLRFNGMLVDVFGLLDDVHANAVAVMASIEATRDFWLADNALRFSEGTGGHDDTVPRLVLDAPATRRGH